MSKLEQYDFSEEKDKVLKMFNKLIEIGKYAGIQLQQDKLKCSMDTPYDYYKEIKGSDFKPLPQPSNTAIAESLIEFAKGIFKHYDVNQSIEENNRKIVGTYVYDKLNIVPQLKGLHCANEKGVNPDLYKVILETINKVKEGIETQTEEKIIYITGVRGSGKTAFLNYFTSKYENELNSQGIITVRINVMRTPSGVKLEDAIKFKLCRILFTYYCSWPTNVIRIKERNRKDYIDSILTRFIDNENFKNESIDVCHDFFCNYNVKELRCIPSEHLKICEKLLEEVSKKYKYIIILDNFDQLSPNKHNKKEYEERKKELENIKSTLIFNHGVFLISVRYSTFRGLSFTGRKKPECWTVGAPSTFDMITKRISYFIENSKSDENTKEKKSIYIENCIKSIGRNFLKEDRELSLEEACNEIESIYAENKRAIINIVKRFISANFQNDISQYELDSHLMRTGYKFFETLPIDTDKGYCKLFFEYLLYGKELVFGDIHSSAHHDHNYMPNIYRFPAVMGDSDMMFSPFLKIRILQLLKNYDEDKGYMTPTKIRSILNSIFSYRRDAIKLACIELREDQSILFKREKYENEHDRDNIPLEITKRGKKILEILPTNVNILAICLEHIYFPIRFLKTGMPIGNYYEESSTNYIIRNLFCSLPKAIGIFNSIEQFEKNLFTKKIETPSSKFEYSTYFNTQNDFSFTEQLRNIANISVEKIFDSHFINPVRIENEKEAVYKKRRNELFNQLTNVMGNE